MVAEQRRKITPDGMELNERVVEVKDVEQPERPASLAMLKTVDED